MATRLVLGEQAEADQLKESCLEFIKPNAAAVMATEGFKEHVASNAPLLIEVMAFMAGAPTGNKGKKRTADEAGLTSEQQEEVGAIRGYKVARLREELQGRGLDTKGRKGELVERLERAITGQGKEGQGSSSSSSSAT